MSRTYRIVILSEAKDLNHFRVDEVEWSKQGKWSRSFAVAQDDNRNGAGKNEGRAE